MLARSASTVVGAKPAGASRQGNRENNRAKAEGHHIGFSLFHRYQPSSGIVPYFDHMVKIISKSKVIIASPRRAHRNVAGKKRTQTS